MPLMRSFSAMSIDCKCFAASPEKGEAAFAFLVNLFPIRRFLRYKKR